MMAGRGEGGGGGGGRAPTRGSMVRSANARCEADAQNRARCCVLYYSSKTAYPTPTEPHSAAAMITRVGAAAGSALAPAHERPRASQLGRARRSRRSQLVSCQGSDRDRDWDGAWKEFKTRTPEAESRVRTEEAPRCAPHRHSFPASPRPRAKPRRPLPAARLLQEGVGGAPPQHLEQRAHGRPDTEAGAGADQPVGPGPLFQVGRRRCHRRGGGAHPASGAAALRQPLHAAVVLARQDPLYHHELYEHLYCTQILSSSLGSAM